MQCLEVSGAVLPLYGSLGFKGLMNYDRACFPVLTDFLIFQGYM